MAPGSSGQPWGELQETHQSSGMLWETLGGSSGALGGPQDLLWALGCGISGGDKDVANNSLVSCDVCCAVALQLPDLYVYALSSRCALEG